MTSPDAVIAAIIVLAAAVISGRWTWKKLQSPPAASPCDGCSSPDGESCPVGPNPSLHQEDLEPGPSCDSATRKT